MKASSAFVLQAADDLAILAGLGHTKEIETKQGLGFRVSGLGLIGLRGSSQYQGSEASGAELITPNRKEGAPAAPSALTSPRPTPPKKNGVVAR